MSTDLIKVLSKSSIGGRRRRQILEYLLESGEATKYRLGRILYGDGLRYQGVITSHVHVLEKIGAVGIRSQGRKKIVFIKEQGRLICTGIGLKTPASLSETFFSELCLVGKGLTDEEIAEGRRILIDEILNVCAEILKRAVEQKELQTESAGYGLAFLGKGSEVKSTCDFSAIYIAAITYYQEKYLLPQFYNTLGKADLNLRSVFSSLEDIANEQPLIALPIVEKNGVEQNFEDLVEWLMRIGSKIPLLGYMPFFLSASPRLSCLRSLITTTVQFKREKDMLVKILTEPKYVQAALRLER